MDQKEARQAWEYARMGDHVRLQNALEGSGPKGKIRIYDPNVDPQTLLAIAAYSNSVDCVKLLLDNEADPNLQNHNGHTPLHFVAFTGAAEVARVLLDRQNVDIHLRAADGKTPLHIAAERGHCTVLKMLIDKGANVNACDSLGETPLFGAIRGNHKNAADLLLRSNADPFHRSANKDTPSTVATLFERSWFQLPNQAVGNDTVPQQH